MGRIKGPGIFLAQFMRDAAPFNSLEGVARWAADLGFKGVQIPAWDARCIELRQAAESAVYCDEIKGKLAGQGLAITELAAHLQGQVLAMHPVYEELFQNFYPEGLRGSECTAWATEQLLMSVRAAARLGVTNVPVLSGGLAWPMMYPWPQRPAGIVEEALRELAARWAPILDAAREAGITITYELHPGSDLFDGATFEMFLDYVNEHPAACINYDPSHLLLQQLDYLAFIQLYGERIEGFHVKDAEYRSSGRVGVYGGYQPWEGRAGRFRSLGDGQVDFKRVFTLLAEAGYDGWAVLEWECCVKSPEQGAREGAPFIARHIIEVTDVAFDDFAGGEANTARNRRLLGLE